MNRDGAKGREQNEKGRGLRGGWESSKKLSVITLQSGVYSFCHCSHTHPVCQFAQCWCECSGGQGMGRETGCLSRCCCNSAAVPVMTSRSV